MLSKLGYIIIFALLGFPSFVVAQSTHPEVHSEIEPDSIGIGDRFTVKVSVTKDMLQVVEFPTFQNGKLDEKIEVLGDSQIDTLSVDGKRITLQKSYTMTTFDEGIYNLGGFPMLFMEKSVADTIYSSDSLLLMVGTFEIDTLTQKIYDIKPTMDTPVKFSEFFGYIVWAIIFVVLLCLGIYLAIQSRRGNRLFGWKPNHIDPPHIVAINALNNLHEEKLWQSGKHKLYYTKIKDILREYIEGRYGICAMEMTSDEIIEALNDKELSAKNSKELKGVLKSADLVKFAKYIPEAEDNEGTYNRAYYFVEETKLVQQQEVPTDEINMEEGQ